jgi:hypothetical protein
LQFLRGTHILEIDQPELAVALSSGSIFNPKQGAPCQLM